MNIKVKEPGIYKDMPNKEYDLIEAERSTTLKTILNDSVKRTLIPKKRRSDALRNGVYIHQAILEPQLLSSLVVKPDFPKGGKGITKAIKEENTRLENIFFEQHGDNWVTQEEKNTINEMKLALFDNQQGDIADLLNATGADNELTAVAWHDETELMLKARIDKIFLDAGIWVDYKTTRSANPKDFLRDAVNLDYDLSAAFHSDVVEMAFEQSGQKKAFRGSGEIKAWFWLVQEKEPPYLSNLIEVPLLMIEEGRRKYKRALEKKKRYNYGLETSYNGKLIAANETEMLLPKWYVNKCNNEF
ncbi:hypothetical protein AB832_08255 [Flavobacteriaceae bacterium (ex Bugula neritina AB1)]|jgi:hypothetical protein|nr:hypothetical protein AB832_08255 [Flavobacteriaceae bacterium (ex Bugula neritina AB1)]